ncbi:MAG: hypothetical protein EP299_08635, partial [Acidobacteria bacterium]
MTREYYQRRGWMSAIILFNLALAAVVVAPPMQAETNINVVLGGKFLDKDDWPLGDNQGALAIQTTFGPKKWPV